MPLLYKPDFDQIRARYEAWWNGDLMDRPLIQVTAPIKSADPQDELPTDEQVLFKWFTDPGIVIPRLERQVERTCYVGDALPLVFPFDIGLPAIEVAYLGCPYRITGNTGWAEPVIFDWGSRSAIKADSENAWWQITRRLLEAGVESARGKYLVGLPDLQGGAEIIVLMRGTERLAVDLFDHPEAVRQALAEEVPVWRYFYDACYEIVHRGMAGYIDWLGIWSERPYATVENDFSTMISPGMFKSFFMPALEQQMGEVERAIFHLDGPGALPHLDLLLSLPRLNGIQWVIGPADGDMVDWIPLLQKIQEAGKNVVVNCKDWEVQPLLKELKPNKILLTTSCSSKQEADLLLDQLEKEY